MNKPTTYKELEQQYFDHINDFNFPARATFYCHRCQTEHPGIDVTEYGQRHLYREYEDGTARMVSVHNGLYLCFVRQGLEKASDQLLPVGPTDTLTPL